MNYLQVEFAVVMRKGLVVKLKGSGWYCSVHGFTPCKQMRKARKRYEESLKEMNSYVEKMVQPYGAKGDAR